jgi:hypothetical protein
LMGIGLMGSGPPIQTPEVGRCAKIGIPPVYGIGQRQSPWGTA